MGLLIPPWVSALGNQAVGVSGPGLTKVVWLQDGITVILPLHIL